MESANLQPQHQQLQELFVGFSSLASAPKTVPTPHEWNPAITISSSGSYNLNPAIARQQHVRSFNSQDFSLSDSRSIEHQTGYEQVHPKARDEPSADSFPNPYDQKLCSPDVINELDLLNKEKRRFSHNLGENQWFNFSIGYQPAGRQIFGTADMYFDANYPSRFGSFKGAGGSNTSDCSSHVFPSFDGSNLDSLSSSVFSTSMDTNLQALNLFSNYCGGASGQSLQDKIGLGKESTSFGHGYMQESIDSPSNSSNKTSTSTRTTKRAGCLSGPKESNSEAKRSCSASRASCPPLKVRKEKLGDRISALQRLVAPFGKTDTASVLQEAIGYIQFLQNQVQTLSVPYMKSSSKPCRKIHLSAGEEDGTEAKKDLRSRGLCLVPMSCASLINGYD